MYKRQTLMRAGDAFIDPIIGAIMDRTSTKWGKFRPFMVIGNLIMIVSSILLYFGTRIISEDMMWLRYLCFILFLSLIHISSEIPSNLKSLCFAMEIRMISSKSDSGIKLRIRF